jgi:hypothetical protein
MVVHTFKEKNVVLPQKTGQPATAAFPSYDSPRASRQTAKARKTFSVASCVNVLKSI